MALCHSLFLISALLEQMQENQRRSTKQNNGEIKFVELNYMFLTITIDHNPLYIHSIIVTNYNQLKQNYPATN